MFQVSNAGSRAGLLADLSALKDKFVTDGYHVHLFKDGLNPTPDTLAAGFAALECNFTGYAVQDIGGVGEVFIGPMINAAGDPVLSTPGMTWIATDAVTPNQVGGYWVESTAGVVRRYGVFPAPVPMISALAFIDMTIFESAAGVGTAEINN